MSYTPGPWGFYKIASGLGVSYRVFSGELGKGARDICHIPVEWSNPSNAHLIAAAPELYEALNEIFHQLEYHEPIWYTRGMYNRAKAALEKAEGKQKTA